MSPPLFSLQLLLCHPHLFENMVPTFNSIHDPFSSGASTVTEVEPSSMNFVVLTSETPFCHTVPSLRCSL